VPVTKTLGGGKRRKTSCGIRNRKEEILTLGHHNTIYTDKKSKEDNNPRKLD